MQDGGQQGFSPTQILILTLDIPRKKFILATNIHMQTLAFKEHTIPMVLEVMNLEKKSKIIHLEYLH